MRRLLVLIFSFFLFVISINAQCPSSSRQGIHVVKANETLYRIATAYKVSVDQICAWNGITYTDVLSVCRELRVAPMVTTTTPPPATTIPTEFNTPVFTTPSNTSSSPPSNFGNYRKQSGKQHTVQPGETFAGIAYLYGYTEARFREINPLPSGHVVTPGSILLSTDCDCPRISYNNNSPTNFATTTSPTGTTFRPTTTTSPTGTNTPIFSPPSTRTSPNTTSPTGTTFRPTTTAPPPTTSATAPATANTRAATYMRPDERSMIDEVNLMRRNPRGYIRLVQEYAARHKREGWSLPANYDDYVNSLISTLNGLSALPEFSPQPCLYNAAKRHGQDMSRSGSFGHGGSDGTTPGQRINEACGGKVVSAENLVMSKPVRDAVMELLIDDGEPSLGHRINLLNPSYKFLGCYRTDKVGPYEDVWVQTFSNGGSAGSGGVSSKTPPPPGRSPSSYMKSIEQEMVAEINLMRSNPRGYVKYVQDYAEERKRVWGRGPSSLYLNELIRELNALSTLSTLEPNECIYNTARNHGEDQKASGKGDVDHKGRDGRSAYDRITQSCSFLTDGTENLVAGKTKVRDAVMVLLIDEGISTRGHRKALLNPNWKYVACYRIGQVGTWNDYWVQNFGY